MNGLGNGAASKTWKLDFDLASSFFKLNITFREISAVKMLKLYKRCGSNITKCIYCFLYTHTYTNLKRRVIVIAKTRSTPAKVVL